MPCTVTGNDWATFGSCERTFKEFSSGIRLPCLSFVGLCSMVKCQPLPHLLHLPEGWVLLFLPFLKETLFLEIPYLQSLLRHPILPQLKHLSFWCLLIALEIASPPQASVLQSNVSAFIVWKIHSSTGADLTFKGPRIFLHSKLAF